MASIVLTAAGYALGAALPGVGAFAGPILGALGGSIGGTLDARLGLIQPASAAAPRLEQLSVQGSREGAPLPLVYGMLRIAGNVIWASSLIESRHKTGSSSDSLKGGSTASATTYTYAVHLAVALGAGPVTAVRRVWADAKLIYNGRLQKQYVQKLRVYRGTADQQPDALLQAQLGSANTPAYRGTAYVVLENLQLQAFGNRIPNLTFEVEGQSGGFAPATLQGLSLAGNTGDDRRAPLLIPSTAPSSPDQLVACGINNAGGNSYNFTVDHYDRRSDGLAFTQRLTTAGFTANSPHFTHALSPDGRTVFMATVAPGSQLQIVLYDVQARSFGPLTNYALPAGIGVYQGPTVWADAQTVLLPATNVYYLGPLAITCLALTPLPQPAAPQFAPLFPDGPNSWPPYGFAQRLSLSGGDSGLLLMAVDTAGTTLRAARVQVQTAASGTTGAALQFATALLPAYTLATVGGTAIGSLGTQKLVPFDDGTGALSLCRVALYGGDRILFETLAYTPDGFGVTRPATLLALPQQFNDALINTGGTLTLVTTGAATLMLAEVTLTGTGFALAQPYADCGGAALLGGASFHHSPGTVALDSQTLAVLTGDQLWLVRRGLSAQSVGAILGDLAARCGLAVTDYDTAAGAATMVAGYVVTQPMSARSAIESLLAAYPFNLAESDGKLRLTDLRAATPLALPPSELAATLDDKPATQTFTRNEPRSIPRALALSFYDSDNLYQQGSARAALDADTAAPAETTSLPLVLSPADASTLAARLLMRAQAERTQLSFAASRACLALDPGDLVQVGSATYTLGRITQQGGLLQLTATSCSQAALDAAPLSLPKALAQTRPVNGASLLALDLPALTDSDDTPGLYLAALASTGSNWPGGVVYDASGTERARLSSPIRHGIATAALGLGPRHYLDRKSTLTVMTSDTLTSCTDAALLAGSNLCLLGGELLQFQTAILTAPGTYQLSNFLRGRYGTESAIGTHGAGEPLFLLEAETLVRLPLTLADRGRPAQLSLVSLGQVQTDVLPQTVTYTLRSLAPWAPVQLAAKQVASDLQLSWVRRARIANGWSDYLDVPLDATSESYFVEILNSSGATVRSATVATPAFTYTAAQQSADFGAAVTSLTCRVAQLTDRYGRGEATAATFNF